MNNPWKQFVLKKVECICLEYFNIQNYDVPFILIKTHHTNKYKVAKINWCYNLFNRNTEGSLLPPLD